MKYLLDTDVVSQYAKERPDPGVEAWLRRTDDSDLYLSEITFAELWYGVHRLAPGKRRAALEAWVEDDLYMQFFNRVEFFGLGTARRYGALVARAEKDGFQPGAMDAMIAAIALERGMTVATLNRKDFQRLGVDVVEF